MLWRHSYHSIVRKLFDVAPGNFMPRPDVTSTVVSFETRDVPIVTPDSEEALFRTIRGAFALRRKTIVNSLATEFKHFSKDDITSCLTKSGISPTCRGETLDLKSLCELSNKINELLI